MEHNKMKRTSQTMGKSLWWKTIKLVRLHSVFILLGLLLSPLSAAGQTENPNGDELSTLNGSGVASPSNDSGGSSGFQRLLVNQSMVVQANSNIVHLPMLRKSVPTIIPGTTVVLSEQTTQHLGAISPDGSTYIFNQITTELAQLDFGDVMVAGVSEYTPDGFLRKVTGIQTDGDQVEVITVQGTLEDAIQQGELHISQFLSPDHVRAVNALDGVTLEQITTNSFSFQLSNVVLFDADGSPSTSYDQVVANGEITVVIGFNLDLTIGFFSLDTLTITTMAQETANLELTTYITADAIDREVPLASYGFAPITVPVGPVPVVFVPTLSLYAGLNGEIHVSVTTSVTQELIANAGLSYADGGWDTIKSLDNHFSWTPPTLSAGMSAKGYLGAGLSLDFYGVAGPYVNIQPYLRLSVDPVAVPWWSLYGGLEVPIGIHVEVLGKELADYSTTVLDTSWLLAAAEPPPPGDRVTVPAGLASIGCVYPDPTELLLLGLNCFYDGGSAYLDTYQIDRYEVTNGQYAHCVESGPCTPPKFNYSASRLSYYDNPAFSNYPVIYVSWEQATDYCSWTGGRLPTNYEWEKARRGTAGKIFPWSSDPPEAPAWEIGCSRANFFSIEPENWGACVGDTTPVGSYPSYNYGTMDMIGNVYEWVSDRIPGAPSQYYAHVARGGHFAAQPPSIQADHYLPNITDGDYYLGFRCAYDS
jgi:hypothetical protein